MQNIDNFMVVVPVFNGGEVWVQAARQLAVETAGVARVLVIDSGSSDGSDRVAIDFNFELICIPNASFDHGGTRQMALQHLAGEDFVVYVTQDSILKTGAIKSLLAAFDRDVSMAYGRQLPRLNAKLVESHARLFNYSMESLIKSKSDISTYGLKTAFCSNSFAAYRVADLKGLGGFPIKSNFGEDMYVAAKMILDGKKVAYVADACCIHSHAYSVKQDYLRSFEIGIFHASNLWILEEFGSAGSEGFRYVISELSYVAKRNFFLVFEVALRTVAKFVGYRNGRRYGLRQKRKAKEQGVQVA